MKQAMTKTGGAILLGAALLAPYTALAQDVIDAQAPQQEPVPTHRKLDEIVVTAQKRAESIQDVPLSISAIDDQFIEDWAITDMTQAVLYTPNVKVTDAGYFILPRIRGFGTNQNNKAFEPPAGVAIDGIPYTRLEYFTAALFDVGRMEVLRGPQGTTFGKNTTAGLIHIISKSPTDEFEASIDVQAGNFARKRVEAAVGGPLIGDVINFRIAALYDDRDGFVDNSATDPGLAPTNMRSTDRKGARIKLDFVDLLGSSLKLSYEYVQIATEGAGLEMFDVTPTMAALMRRYDPNVDLERANGIGTITDPDFRDMSVSIFSADWRMDLGDYSLVGIAGYSVLKSEAALDIDGSPIHSLAGTDKDRSPTMTGELRLESPELEGFLGLNNLFGMKLGSSNFLAGAYYQRREIQGDGISYTFGLPILEMLLAGQSDSPNTQVPALVGDVLEAVFGVAPPLNALPLLGDYDEVAIQDFDQTANAYAVFGHVEWNFLPRWSAQFGMRLSTETKKASFNQYYEGTGPYVLMPVVGVEEYQTVRSFDETKFAPRVALIFALNDDVSFFLHWARGFRGGGFNAFAFRNNEEELLYQSETADDYGFDIKTSFWDGRARLNMSLFRLDVTDFQVLTGRQTDLGIGLGQSIVENAPKARSQGAEVDFTWLPLDWLTVFATLGWNDTEYLDFTFNGCFPDNPNVDGDDDNRCDATGKPFPITPQFSSTLLMMATIPLSAKGYVMQVGGGLDFQSRQYSNFSLDARYQQSSVVRYRATIGFGNIYQGWTLKVQGENLTDEVLSVRQGQVNRGYVIEGVEKPRTIYATLHANF